MSFEIALAIVLWIGCTVLAFGAAFTMPHLNRSSIGIGVAGCGIIFGLFWFSQLQLSEIINAFYGVESGGAVSVAGAATGAALAASFFTSARPDIRSIATSAVAISAASILSGVGVVVTSGTPSAAAPVLSISTIVNATLLGTVGMGGALWSFFRSENRILEIMAAILLPLFYLGAQWIVISETVVFVAEVETTGLQWFGIEAISVYGLVIFALVVLVSAEAVRSRTVEEVESERTARAIDVMDAVLSTNGIPVVALDDKRNVIFFNQPMQAHSGISEQDAIGSSAEEMAEKFGPSWLDAVETALKGTTATYFRTRDVPDRRDMRISCSPLIDTKNGVRGVVTVFTDVTSLNNAQHAARDANRMQVVGRAAAGYVHEFNNVLHVIQTSAKGVREGDRPSVERLSAAVARGRSLSRSLGRLARAPDRGDDGAAIVDPLLLERRLSEVALQTAEGRADVVFRVDDLAWSVRCDPDDLDFAILNLVSNAVEACETWGKVSIGIENVTLTSAQRTTLKPGDYLAVRVKDNGCGIEPSERSSLFLPTYTTKGGPAGLGLVQVREFADAWGGDVEIISFPGNGSRFTIYLPRYDEKQGGSSQRASTSTELAVYSEATAPAADGSAENAPVSAGSVLVVTSDAILAERIVESLTEANWAVASAFDADAALEILDEFDVDVVIIDPDLERGADGYALARMVGARWQVEIIIMTAAKTETSSRTERMAYLARPFSMPTFESLLAELRDGRDAPPGRSENTADGKAA